MSKARKVRPKALHQTREQMSEQRAVAFSKRVALNTTHRVRPLGAGVEKTGKRVIEERDPEKTRDVDELTVMPPKMPGLYPRIAA